MISVKRSLMVVISLLVICLFTSMATADVVNIKETEELRQARELLDSWSGQKEILEKAKSVIDTQLRKNPQNYLALKELARYTIMNGYLYSIDYSNGKYLYSIGKYKKGTLEKAKMYLKHAISINAKFADGYVLLGYVYEQMRRFDDAKNALTKAEEIGTDNPWLELNWASVLFNIGDLEQAALRYRNIINNGTNNNKALTTAYEYLIKYHRDRGEHLEVRDLYQRMMTLRPNSAWARGNYAKYLMDDLGLYDEAIKYAVEALEIMDYQIGRTTLAYALYSKWADLIINHGVSEGDAQEYLASAYQLYPNVNLVMAYRGARNNGNDLVQALMSRNVSIDARTEDGSTALIIASNTGQTEAVRNLLLHGANINVSSKNGWTALLGAADEGHYEVVKILLENGADKTQKISGMLPEQLADRRGNKILANYIRDYK